MHWAHRFPEKSFFLRFLQPQPAAVAFGNMAGTSYHGVPATNTICGTKWERFTFPIKQPFFGMTDAFESLESHGLYMSPRPYSRTHSRQRRFHRRGSFVKDQ